MTELLHWIALMHLRLCFRCKLHISC